MTAWHRWAAFEPTPEVHAIAQEIDTLRGFTTVCLFNPGATLEDVRTVVQAACAQHAGFEPTPS